ncbi:OsmC family protein [Oryzibacter oryziterrae]|uniref:OsmC family protein n=1 Tax=Oryzibacter oryziterrae TaxID=2766474 RepID=UPI001F2CE3C1|nr:OsmC family protein [Oryzibacter oryziterrae]
MAEVRIRQRGAKAFLPKQGKATVTALSGAEAQLAGSPSQPGLNPLELLDASLAGCLALSIRIAAGNLGVSDRLGDVAVESIGEKAPDAPSRIARIVNKYKISGNLTQEERLQLVAEAHKICTIGNSIAGSIAIVDEEIG